MLQTFYGCDGEQFIEQLQTHEMSQIYQRAVKILENHFGGEEETNVSGTAPATNGQQYAFGVPGQQGFAPQGGFNFR